MPRSRSGNATTARLQAFWSWQSLSNSKSLQVSRHPTRHTDGATQATRAFVLPLSSKATCGKRALTRRHACGSRPSLPGVAAKERLHKAPRAQDSPRARIMRSRSTAIEKVNISAGTRKAPSRALSLEPNRYAVRCPFRIDHRQTDESSPIRHPRGVSPKLVLQHGRAVDEPCERR